jgi:hypothetical protein
MLKPKLRKGDLAMIKALVVNFIFLALVISGCAGSPNTKPLTANMDAQYRMLVEKDKIIEVINRLFISTDNRDWSEVKKCFSSTVLLDMTSLAGGQPVTLTSQEIVDAWDQGLKALKSIHHQVGNYMVSINQDEAEAFCYGIASHYLPNKTNQHTRIFVGSYNFHLTKEGQSWRIDQFKFNLKYIDGNPNLEGSQ